LNQEDKQIIRKMGTVMEALPSVSFLVKLDDGPEVIAHLAGKLRLYRIKVLAGDRVTVEMSPYDNKRGRIVYRGK
jgi:translation initiation factor IF-1